MVLSIRGNESETRVSLVKSLDNLWARMSGDSRVQHAEIKGHTQHHCLLESNLLLWDKARVRALPEAMGMGG